MMDIYLAPTRAYPNAINPKSTKSMGYSEDSGTMITPAAVRKKLPDNINTGKRSDSNPVGAHGKSKSQINHI